MTAANDPFLPSRNPPFGGTVGAHPLLRQLAVQSLSVTCMAEAGELDSRHRLPGRWVLVATLSGHAQIRDRQHSFIVGPGVAYAAPPDHAFREVQQGDAPWVSVAVIIEVGPVFRLLDLSRDRLHRQPLDAPACRRYVQFAQLLDTKPALLELACTHHLAGICHDFQLAAAAAPPPAAFVDHALAYMRDNLRRLVTVGEMAAHCAMSESAFAHRFKTETGVSPMRAFDRERIRLARELLMDGHSVTEAAAQLGFATPYHFSRVFKRIEGVPPRRIRQLGDRRW